MPYMTQKLTNSSNETSIKELFSGDVVFSIPYFQRAYKWKNDRIKQFKEDLEALLDYESSHFLGAIIVFGKDNGGPSDPKVYEVIDGQQRLTTCYLALIALARVFSMHNMTEDALGLYKKFILINQRRSMSTNAKIICCKKDRASMNRVFQDLMSESSFFNSVKDTEYEYKFMQNSGRDDERAWQVYRMFIEFFENKYLDAENDSGSGAGRAMLLDLYGKLVDNMRLVEIVVLSPTDGPKIFDGLNSKQEPMTIGDLVRNEIFSKYANQNADAIDALEQNHWYPFYQKFDQRNNPKYDQVFEQYFFPYVLTIDHSVKKGDAFNFLRERWASIDNPVDIIRALETHQNVFLDLVYGTSFSNCPPTLAEAINRLSRLNAPSSVYPFIMLVVAAVKNNQLPDLTATAIIERVESFLVRRAICGYEPTGLHAVFKSLWYDCNNDYSVENVAECIKQHVTVTWPDDEEVRAKVIERPLHKAAITPYILAEWDKELGGDIPILDSKHIEHVLPRNPKSGSQWLADWSKEERDAKTDCLANLLPLSGSLNDSIKNADYAIKQHRYIDDSALKAPRDFAQKYSTWTPADFNDRAEKIADWVLDRWKY